MTLRNTDINPDLLDDNTLPTGVTVLDNELLNGVPKGSTIAVLGDPLGMAELFLYHLVHTDRETHYVSTVRPERNIRKSLNNMGDLQDDALSLEAAFSTSNDSTEVIKKHAARVKEDHNLIIDTVSNVLSDTQTKDYIQTLRNVYKDVQDNNGLAYLYFANNDLTEFERAEREALHMCDGVFRVTTELNGDNIDTRLEIHKMRGVDFPDEEIKLNVGQKLTVDTTRDIA